MSNEMLNKRSTNENKKKTKNTHTHTDCFEANYLFSVFIRPERRKRDAMKEKKKKKISGKKEKYIW